MNEPNPPRRSQPPLMDGLGKLCTEGKQLADYLWQVPKDEPARHKIVAILDQIAAEAGKQGRKRNAAHLRGAQDRRQGDPSPQQVDVLVTGFDRLVHLCRPPSPVCCDEARERRRSAPRPRRITRSAVHQHRPPPRDGRGRAGRFRPPRHRDGARAVAYVLWQRHLRFNPANPNWFGRDRFVLSAGHACMLLYAGPLPHRVRPLARRHQAVPPVGEPYAGPLRARAHAGRRGHDRPARPGCGNAVGMALAEAHLAQLFNRPSHTVVDHCTYFLASDGDLWRACRTRPARWPAI